MSGIQLGQLSFAQKLCAMLACAIISFSLSPASADTIEIHFTGINIAYDGTDIVDADPGANDPDPLVTATIIVEGNAVGTLTTGLTADLLIDDVAVLAGQTVMNTGANSFFRLEFPDGSDGDLNRDFINLELTNVMVTYLDSSPKDFVFTATVASGITDSVSLPLGAFFLHDEPITLSFSAQTSSVTHGAGDVISAFTANGTGEVRGEFDIDRNQRFVPEPASVGMAVLAGLMGGVYAMRKRLG